MSRVANKVTDTVTIQTGIGGNVYAFCSIRDTLIILCDKIGKSPNSIYFNKKHNCYAIRSKLKRHIEALLQHKYPA